MNNERQELRARFVQGRISENEYMAGLAAIVDKQIAAGSEHRRIERQSRKMEKSFSEYHFPTKGSEPPSDFNSEV